jgi:SOS response regulatory protein OraA/RecX
LLHPHHQRCARTLNDKQQENAGDENILKQITEYFYEENWLDSFPTTTEAISTNY